MRILYISQYFPPEAGAPSARVHELARSWVKAGHEVTVLTAFPHHPTGIKARGDHGATSAEVLEDLGGEDLLEQRRVAQGHEPQVARGVELQHARLGLLVDELDVGQAQPRRLGH